MVGIYESTVADQYVPYIVPQEHGHKTDVRWLRLTNAAGTRPGSARRTNHRVFRQPPDRPGSLDCPPHQRCRTPSRGHPEPGRRPAGSARPRAGRTRWSSICSRSGSTGLGFGCRWCRGARSCQRRRARARGNSCRQAASLLPPAAITPVFTLLPGAEPLLAGVAQGKLADVRAYHLQLMAQRLGLVAGFDDLLCLDAIDFAPFDYQIRAARTALRRFRGRGLLSDEVGLGRRSRPGWCSRSTCCARWCSGCSS